MASDFAIRLAAHHVRHGGVIIYPTETVYGLGCDPLNSDAVVRVNSLKGRDPHKGLILLAGTIEQLMPFIDPDIDLDPATLLHAEKPTSWIVPGHPGLPPWISAPDGSIAVRITRHPVVNRLCRLLGYPLVSTSANPSGARPATRPLQLQKYFHGMVQSVLVSGEPMSGQPSTVRRLTDNATVRE